MAKRRIDRKVDMEKANVTFTELASKQTVICGVDVVGLTSTTFKALPAMAQRAILHGLNAKVGDSAADPDENAIDVMKEVMAQLKQGQWASRTAGSGPRTTILIEAIVKLTGQKSEAVELRLDKMTEEEVKNLRTDVQVKAAMDDINAARAAARAAETKKAAADAAKVGGGFKF